MPNAFSQIYIQIVFAVRNREALIASSWEERLYQYITAIVQNKQQKMLAINGVDDYIHIFIGLKPDCCISDLVREVKKSSSVFIKENNLTKHPFNWQTGFGAFSYGHSQIDVVCKYVMNQKEHHKKQSFKEEYIQFLKNFSVQYDEQYLFDWFE